MISGRTRVLVVSLLLLCNTFAANVYAQAQPARADGWGIDQLMQELAGTERASARFVEQRFLRVLESPLELTGKLVYRAPDRLEKHTLTPKPESMTIEGNRLVIESTSSNRRRVVGLQDYPVLWGFIESLRATLGGDLQTLERFYRVELDGRPDAWRLSLAPRDRQMSDYIRLITITGAGGWISKVEVHEAQGDRSVMRIYEDTA
jgi:outer membrane lipoprotein-sorting protein